MDYEQAKECAKLLAKEVAGQAPVRNEATTRLQIIDRLFFECLDWERADCTAEERLDGQYSDYTFATTARVLIVEAKREGVYFEVPAGQATGERSIPSLGADSPSLKSAIEQAAAYCQQRGVPVGAVCNGRQLVAFLASRNDGTPPLEGRALVFPDLESIASNFRELWDALSRKGILEGKLRSRLARRAGLPLPPKLSAAISQYPGTKRRNIFQSNLQILSELVIEDIPRSRSFEPTFLKYCFAASGALSQHALLSKSILKSRYDALFGVSDKGPAIEPAAGKRGISDELLAESLSRRPILLLGDVGAGKTTFIRHLIKVDYPALFSDSITLYVDLGWSGALAKDLREFFLQEVDRQLREEHDVDISEARFVSGIYHSELARFDRGI